MTKKPSTPAHGGFKEPPDGGRFARQLGEFMMNCGYLEFHSYAWLMVLSPSFELPREAGKISFSDRIRWISERVKKRALSSPVRAEVRGLWNEAKRISEIRNMIAHGPMVWGHNPDGSLFGAVPSIKNAIAGKPQRFMQYDDIVEYRLECAEVVIRLQQALDRLGRDLGIQLPTSTDPSQDSK